MDPQTLDPNRFAAIVYDDGVKVDGLMSGFARELVEAGIDARGIVQLPPDADGCGPGALMKASRRRDRRDHPAVPEPWPRRRKPANSTPRRSPAPAQRLRGEASRPSDILFFSKFGKQEASGAGMRAELAYAISEGRTVLTAVKRPLLPVWRSFTGGQGTLLEGRLWVVRDWWAYVSYARREAA